MTTGEFLGLIAAVAAAGLLISQIVALRSRIPTATRPSKLGLQQMKLLNQFNRRINRGESLRLLARVYSQMDVSLIQSILASIRVIARVEFGITNNMRTGLGIEGYNDIWLFVLQNDYSKSREVMIEYLKCRERICGSINRKTRLRNIAEALLLGWAVNMDYRSPELLACKGNDIRTLHLHKGPYSESLRQTSYRRYTHSR